MISLDIVSDFVYENFEGVKPSKNGTHWLCRCSICGDSKKSLSKKRLNIDYNNGNPIFHCFNCSESGSFFDLYSFVKGVSKKEAVKILLRPRWEDVKREKTVSIIPKEEITRLNTYHDSILTDCLSLNQPTESYQQKRYQEALAKFYEDRKIPSDVKVYVAWRGRFQSRFILPILDEEGHILYFQGRRIIDSMEPKYLNPPSEKSTIIFNKHKFARDKYIIATEGLLDAISIGNQGTSYLGAELTTEFINELQKLTDKGIIIAPDNDKRGMETVAKFLDSINIRKWSLLKVLFFLYPYPLNDPNRYKDINNIVVELAEENIYDFIVNNSGNVFEAHNILIRRKLLKNEIN